MEHISTTTAHHTHISDIMLASELVDNTLHMAAYEGKLVKVRAILEGGSKSACASVLFLCVCVCVCENTHAVMMMKCDFLIPW